MKKIIILVLMVLFLVSGIAFGDDQKAEKAEKKSSPQKSVTKTYTLKHISPHTVIMTLRPYIENNSYHPDGKMITVTIPEENIVKFEELLKQMDVERKKVLVRIFTVIATPEGKGGDILNQDLQQVLAELQKVLSFKAFRLDGVSAITVRDGQDRSELQLSSQSPLILRLGMVSIKGDKQGQRSVEFRFELRHRIEPLLLKEGSPLYETLIESETSVKEDGYLVAGVSKIKNGDSLVLIINAKIE